MEREMTDVERDYWTGDSPAKRAKRAFRYYDGAEAVRWEDEIRRDLEHLREWLRLKRLGER